ncbi:gamma-glutamylcyclotransferase [Bacillus shivajii]|uniref:gamma-glutamylcyclotransferase n=1 Tax=Bacillus shivajii TaxID=1983719 RepID=UPI001CFBC0F4|nr:gamma-glutamylcyclotransferase family protein [Bacillus shivajii]UCZ55140.1 gamma-glutamylcyclotransferase [Bacillus shivajii]
MGERQYVFVYGTLRKHCRNHNCLQGAKLVSEQTRVQGQLVDTGAGYPALLLDTDGMVYGELYEIDHSILQTLDVLEGYDELRDGNLYERCKQTVFTDMGEYEAIVYYMNEKNHHSFTEIECGDWKRYLFEKNEPAYFEYFAFGSCMDTERFETGGVAHLFEEVTGVGKLDGYELSYSIERPDGSRADINEEEDYVEGIVYHLPFEALEYLYRREGVYAGLYRPIFVDLQVGEKQLKDVLSFTVVDKQEDTRPPDHYALEILRGAQGRVSDEYFEKMKKQMSDLGVDVDQLLKQI